jgi:hypothetical protein
VKVCVLRHGTLLVSIVPLANKQETRRKIPIVSIYTQPSIWECGRGYRNVTKTTGRQNILDQIKAITGQIPAVVSQRSPKINTRPCFKRGLWTTEGKLDVGYCSVTRRHANLLLLHGAPSSPLGQSSSLNSRLGGVVVSVPATRSNGRGFKHGRGDGFLTAIKSAAQLLFEWEVKPEVPCRKILRYVKGVLRYLRYR